MLEVADNLYEELQKELSKPDPNIFRVLFLTGAVHSQRVTNGYKVPEIENAFIFIRNRLGRSEEEWLLKQFIVPERSML